MSKMAKAIKPQFTFRGTGGDLTVHPIYTDSGVYGILKGTVTLEKCQTVADAMGYTNPRKIGRIMYNDYWR
jgi:hypothetical protein